MALIYNMIGNLKVVIGTGVILEAVLLGVYFVKAPLLEGSFRKVLSVFYMNGRLQTFLTASWISLRSCIIYLSLPSFCS